MNNETKSEGLVTAVCKSADHSFSKLKCEEINLLAGFGVEGDAHAGKTVKHRSRVAADPSQPNLRQVHLIHSELHDALQERGFHVGPGVMGENITTLGVDLLGLPQGTRLAIGPDAIVEITGLRNPCRQLNNYQQGLMNAVLEKDADGALVRKSGVMGIVVASGIVKPGDAITINPPPHPWKKLAPV